MLQVRSKEKGLFRSLNWELPRAGKELVCIQDVEMQVISDAVGAHGVVADSQMRVGRKLE